MCVYAFQVYAFHVYAFRVYAFTKKVLDWERRKDAMLSVLDSLDADVLCLQVSCVCVCTCVCARVCVRLSLSLSLSLCVCVSILGHAGAEVMSGRGQDLGKKSPGVR